MKYLFYIEGLGREQWQSGDTEGRARKALWNALSDDEKNAVVQIECLDEVDPEFETGV